MAGRDFRHYLNNDLMDYPNVENWDREAQDTFLSFMGRYPNAKADEAYGVVEDMLERRSGKGLPQMMEKRGSPSLLQGRNADRQKKLDQIKRWSGERNTTLMDDFNAMTARWNEEVAEAKRRGIPVADLLAEKNKQEGV
jgi:hypothetical protein